LFGKVPVKQRPRHKDGVLMTRPLLFAFLLSVMVAALAACASAGSDHKIAIHVLPHSSRACGNLPEVPGCVDINHTLAGCGDVDVYPVIYDISGITGIEIGLTWPEAWGSCAFTPCGMDFTISEIHWPGDGISGTWLECQTTRSIVIGFGWLAPTSAGLICPSPHRISGFIGVTDCSYAEFGPSAVFCAGVCGAEGDDPCGGPSSEGKTWGSIKSMYR